MPLGEVVDTAKRSKEESALAIDTPSQHFTHDVPSSLGPTPDRASEIQVLSRLDNALVEVLLKGDIRLLSTAWLLAQPGGYLIERRQDLEKREERGESPLLSRQEAFDLVRRGDRSVGAFTYGWLSPGNPDPLGTRLAVLRIALAQLPHIEGLFWDFASLFQVLRTPTEDKAFGRSLPAMNQLYASAVGTTVLQLKEIPPTPEEYLGALCLFGVADTISEVTVKKAFNRFGKIVSCELDGPLRTSQNAVVVRFASHTEALAAKAGGAVVGVCAGADTLYNEHPYERRGWVESSGIQTLMDPQPPHMLPLIQRADGQTVFQSHHVTVLWRGLDQP